MNAVPAPVRQYLQKQPRFLINDLAAATGLSLFEARQATETLMEYYECRLQATPEGNILYHFGKRKGEKTWNEQLAQLSAYAYKAFTVFFKICISAILLIYFIVFLVVLIALIIAVLSGGDSDGDSDIDLDIGATAFFGELFVDIFQSVLIWDAMTVQTYQDRDARGYTYKRYQPKPSKFAEARAKKRAKKGLPVTQKEPHKRFVYSVYDFVFGEKRYEPAPLAKQREIASFLRQNNGILTISDIIKLNGLERSEAEKLFSDVLIRFEGTPSVSKEGVLYGDFSEFIQQEVAEEEEQVTYYWDEYEPEYKLTGNAKGRNTLIIFLNSFNLFFAFLGMTEFFNVMLELPEATWMIVVLGWIPFFFSLTFFLIPTIRYFTLLPLRQKREQHNLRKRVLKVVFLEEQARLSTQDVQRAVNENRGALEELSLTQIAPILEALQHELEAETRIRAEEKSASMVFDFSSLRETQEVSQRLSLGGLDDSSLLE